MYELVNIGGHGLGDCLLSLQISKILTIKNITHINLISTRNEIYEALEHIVKNKFQINQIDSYISENNNIENNIEIISDLKYHYNANHITYNVPDLLFTNPLAINLKKYNLSPQIIKKTKILDDINYSKEKIIYCGLTSNTEGYMYKDILNLLKFLCYKLPDYTIYFPYVKHWVKNIEYNFDILSLNIPNLWIDCDPKFNDSIDILKKSIYGIFTCNGPSHIAYHMNIPRLILDPQFYKIIWMSRWKEDYEECIDINTESKLIGELVYHNIQYPQTTMIDRKIILDMISKNILDWKSLMYFKY